VAVAGADRVLTVAVETAAASFGVAVSAFVEIN
jgi:hypothetical protein